MCSVHVGCGCCLLWVFVYLVHYQRTIHNKIKFLTKHKSKNVELFQVSLNFLLIFFEVYSTIYEPIMHFSQGTCTCVQIIQSCLFALHQACEPL